MSKALSITLYLYAALCAVVIYVWPRNKYEWMLSDPDAAHEKLTFCTLPIDPMAAWAAWFAAVPLLLFVAVAAGLSLRAGRLHPSAWVAGPLLLYWLAKFFLFSPAC